MKTFKITQTFDGYPNGKKTTYREGETVEVSNEFAQVILDNGYGHEVSAAEARSAKQAGEADGDADRPESARGARRSPKTTSGDDDGSERSGD